MFHVPCSMFQILSIAVEEKQKYHITFFCEKNESIILHHVPPNSPENVFLQPLLFRVMNAFARKFDRRIILSYCEKKKVNYYVWMKNIFLSTNSESVILQISTL